MIERRSPLVSLREDVLAEPGEINLTSNNFVFAIRIHDEDWTLERAYISFSLEWRHYYHLSNGT